LALGAVVDSADPQVLINEGLAEELAVEPTYITSETARQLSEIERRRRIYLGDKPPPALGSRTVIIVDDGIATGSTARAALRAVRKAGARRIVLAVPVAPENTIEQLRAEVDEIVCLSSPSPLIAVGAHYGKFPQLADVDIIALLAERHQAMTRSPGRTRKD
jgi:putative phosphoribosyl transferase